MENMTLVEQLTWAIVEVTNPAVKPDLTKVAEVLSLALGAAIVSQADAKRVKDAFIKTVQSMG